MTCPSVCQTYIPPVCHTIMMTSPSICQSYLMSDHCTSLTTSPSVCQSHQASVCHTINTNSPSVSDHHTTMACPSICQSNHSSDHHGIIPFTAFVLRVKLHGFQVVSGDEVPKHVSLGSPDLPDLTLLDCPCKDFILLGKASESTPSL